MTENGRVVVFRNEGAYGFLEVADAAWEATGERLFFTGAAIVAWKW